MGMMWRNVRGNWQRTKRGVDYLHDPERAEAVSSGDPRSSAGEAPGIVLLQTGAPRDVVVEARVRVGGKHPIVCGRNRGMQAGVLLRAEPGGKTGIFAGLNLVLGRNARSFLSACPILSSGEADPQALYPTAGGVYEPGRSYDLRVELRGDLITILIDGRVRARSPLRKLTTGSAVCLVAAGANVRFQRVRIGEPPNPGLVAMSRPIIPCSVNSVYRNAVRGTRSLRGQWEFRTDPRDVGLDARWFERNVKFDRVLDVPGCWEAQGIGGAGKRNLPNLWHHRYLHPDQEVAGTYTGAAWYRRRVRIPRTWRNRRLWLKIGGVHATGWFWVNGRFINAFDNPNVSVRYDITDAVEPGRDAVIVALVDNRMPAMRGCLNDYVACFGGLFRDVELEATDPVWIRDVWPTADTGRRRARVRVVVENLSTKTFRGTVAVRAQHCDGGKYLKTEESLTLAAGASKEVDVALSLKGARLWSPAEPNLNRLDVSLCDADGHVQDAWVDRVGWRTLSADEKHIYVNNKPIFVGGLADYHLFVDTIAPPADKAEHLWRLRKIQRYGYNYRRHHTHVPITEYFQAADEAGMMVQMDLPYAQPFEILKELAYHTRNHVSSTTCCMTNEAYPGNPELAALYHEFKRLDPTRFAIDSDGQSPPLRETADFWTPFPFSVAYYEPHYPRRLLDIDYVDRPAVPHEFLNLPTLPDTRELDLFTGAVGKPPAYVEMVEWAKRKGVAHKLDQYIEASHYHQRLFVKLGFETVRAHKKVHGVSHWTVIDYLDAGQVGLLTPFYNPKGVTPGDMAKVNSPSAIIALLEDWTCSAGQTLVVPVVLSHFGNRPFTSATLRAVLKQGRRIVSRQVRRGVRTAADGVFQLGDLCLAVPHVSKAARLTLELTLSQGRRRVSNDWDVWVYPTDRSEISTVPTLVDMKQPDLVKRRFPDFRWEDAGVARPDDLVVGEHLSTSMLDHMRRGGRAILVHPTMLPHRKVRFTPGWWTPHPMHTQGVVIHDHPALRAFPHRRYADWQIEHLIDTGILYDRVPFKLIPIMESMTYVHAERRFEIRAPLAETRVGRGRMLLCGLNCFQHRPEAIHLFDELVRYCLGRDFQPAISRAEATRALQALTEGVRSAGSSGHGAGEGTLIRWEDDDQDVQSR